MRVYATAEQYEAYTYGTAPADIDGRLARASKFLDANVFRYCWYRADDATGLPTDAVVAAAFTRAVCAQAEWGVETGDVTGAGLAGWGSVRIGDVQLGRSVTSVSGADSPGRQVAPAVGDALRSPDLTPDKFVMGVVASC
ncbi:hypothetical protein LG634_24625 [Streptomyces bambusae]|uniref:hypothetical protein n=1 Tax=Streptomyces bambusae TaxID=1550616 RepID=UPI001CFF1F9E|nr:hypothetical protein [Streptomyces bambusae]MCB5167999.1 hypothetical protein [Streptomyces bambusae]